MNADRINDLYHGDLRNPTVQRCRERIHWICREAKGPRVIDVGCSQGIASIILGREGFNVTGVDIEPAALERARKDLGNEAQPVNDRVDFELADATSLPFPDEQFDTVILAEILEHLTHPVRVLAEARRVCIHHA